MRNRVRQLLATSLLVSLICLVAVTIEPLALLKQSHQSRTALAAKAEAQQRAGVELAARRTPEVAVTPPVQTPAKDCSVFQCRPLPPRLSGEPSASAIELTEQTLLALGHSMREQPETEVALQWAAPTATTTPWAAELPVLPDAAPAATVAVDEGPSEIETGFAAVDEQSPRSVQQAVDQSGWYLPVTTDVGLPPAPPGRRQALNCEKNAQQQWLLSAKVSHRAYQERLIVCRYPQRVTIDVDWRTSDICAPRLEMSVGDNVRLARPVPERRRHDTDSIVLRFDDGHLLVRCEAQRWQIREQGQVALR